MIELLVITFLLVFLGVKKTLNLFFTIAAWCAYGILLLIVLSTEHYVIFGLLLLIPRAALLGDAFVFVFWTAYGVGLIVALVNGYTVTGVLMILFPFALALIGYIVDEAAISGDEVEEDDLSVIDEQSSSIKVEINVDSAVFSDNDNNGVSDDSLDCRVVKNEKDGEQRNIVTSVKKK